MLHVWPARHVGCTTLGDWHGHSLVQLWTLDVREVPLPRRSRTQTSRLCSLFPSGRPAGRLLEGEPRRRGDSRSERVGRRIGSRGVGQRCRRLRRRRTFGRQFLLVLYGRCVSPAFHLYLSHQPYTRIPHLTISCATIHRAHGISRARSELLHDSGFRLSSDG